MSTATSWLRQQVEFAKTSSWLWRAAIIFVFIVTGALTFTAAKRIREQDRRDLDASIVTVLHTTQGALHVWREDLQNDIEALASLPRLRQIAVEQSADLSELEEVLRPWVVSHRYLSYALFVADRSGRLKPLFPQLGWKGFPAGSAEVIRRALANGFTLGRPVVSTDAVVMVAATPIRRASGKPLAVLAFTLGTYDTFTEVTQLGRIGETGETYVVDRSGRVVTGSRFKKAFDTVNVSQSRMGKSLLKGESATDLDGYPDYRGRLVVGTWEWSRELGLGVVTELDRDEAYRSLTMNQRLVWTMIAFLIIGMSTVLLFREARARNLKRIFALQESNQARKELLATVSHDLKNPLSALLMNNEILLKTLPLDFEFTQQRKTLLERSRRAAQQMRRLITDLLDSAKIEAGKLEIHPIESSAGDVVRQAVDLLEPIAAQKGLRLTQEIPASLPLLFIDPERVVQVLSNLLGNAIKFTETGGEISIRARQDHPAWVTFAVSDTGTGISQEDLPHLFERYWQAKKTQAFGTGLGLAICKELVEAHGGAIWAESELGRGTTFRFRVRTAQAVALVVGVG